MKIGKIGKDEINLDFWATLWLALGIQLLTTVIFLLCYIIFIFGLAYWL